MKLKVSQALNKLRRLEQTLAACAYWAASGLHHTSSDHNRALMLANVFEEVREYGEHEDGRDSSIKYEGKVWTYTPVGGWPEPKRELM